MSQAEMGEGRMLGERGDLSFIHVVKEASVRGEEGNGGH